MTETDIRLQARVEAQATHAPQGSGAGFTVGLAFWPGGTEADWGDPITGVQPCNAYQQANLVRAGAHGASARPLLAAWRNAPALRRAFDRALPPAPGPCPARAHPQTSLGVHFSSYHARVDRLSVLKTTFAEQLSLTADAPAGTPLLISVVAFRCVHLLFVISFIYTAPRCTCQCCMLSAAHACSWLAGRV